MTILVGKKDLESELPGIHENNLAPTIIPLPENKTKQPCSSYPKCVYRPLSNLDLVMFWSKHHEWSPRLRGAQEEHSWNCL